jgi:hypothetical protein
MAKLRFIQRCARTALQFASLITETETLLERLQLSRAFPTSGGGLEFNGYDWCCVSERVPQAHATGMDATIQNLIEANSKIESQDAIYKLRALIREIGSAVIKSIGATIGTVATQFELEDAVEDAVGKTLTAIEKMDDV